MSTDDTREPTEPLAIPDAGTGTGTGAGTQDTEPIRIGQAATQQFETTPFETKQFETTTADTLLTAPVPTDPELTDPDSRADRTDAAPAAAAEPAKSAATSSGVSSKPSLRVGTVVWGLILAIIGAGVIAVAAGAQFDIELALIGLLVLAGVGLLVGSIVTSARHRRS